MYIRNYVQFIRIGFYAQKLSRAKSELFSILFDGPDSANTQLYAGIDVKLSDWSNTMDRT